MYYVIPGDVNVTAKWIDFTKGRITIEVTIEAESLWEGYFDAVSCQFVTFEQGASISLTNDGSTVQLRPENGVTIISQNVTSGELCSLSTGRYTIATSLISVSIFDKHECLIGADHRVKRIGKNPELK